MKRKILIVILIITLTLIFLFFSKEKKENIEIHIGYQSVTAQTWGALIIKNTKSFENKVKEIYGENVKVVWHDEISGAVINTNMIANKVHIGFMGDMPLILNLYKSSTRFSKL